ncbi:MAG: ATP-binding protein [Planctomycetota bacterium]
MSWIEELRRRAESALGDGGATPAPHEPDRRHLLHELEVHQLELELQNEALLEARRELAAERARYAELFLDAPLGYLVVDAGGRVLEANREAARLLGDGLEGQVLASRLRPAQAARWVAHLRRALARDEAVSGELELAGDGGDRIVQLRTRLHGRSCRVALLEVTGERERGARLAHAVERARLAALVIDPRGVVLEANRAAVALFGYAARADVVGLELERLIPAGSGEWQRLGDTPSPGLPALERARSGEPGLQIEARRVQARRLGGARFPVELTRVVGAHGTTLLVRDLGAERLASTAIHEQRNVFMGVEGLAARALDDPARAQALAGEVLAAARRGREMADQLLDLRRGGGERRPLQLDPLLRELRPLLGSLLPAAVELSLELQAPGHALRAADGWLERVALNLVLNARDALRAGGRVILRTEPAPGGVAIVVIDDGDGMDEDTLARCLDAFFTTRPGGSGLGLAVVGQIARDLGGQVEVGSAPGLGTTVRVTLPARREASAPEPPAGPAPAGGGRAVLVVEDDPLVRSTIAYYLEGAGDRPLVCAEVDAALALPAEREVDAIVCDVSLLDPGDLDRLRHRCPRARVLLVSAFSREQLQAEGLLPAGLPLLQKPFGPRALAERLHELCGGERGGEDADV